MVSSTVEVLSVVVSEPVAPVAPVSGAWHWFEFEAS